MIFDSATQVLIDNMGWADKGSLWLYDIAARKERLLSVDGSAYLTIRPGVDGLFRLTHHESPEQEISIRHASAPHIVLASVSLAKKTNVFDGDISLWNKVERALVFNTGSYQRLVRIDAASQSIVDVDLSWYNANAYDLGYQGLVDCLTPPDLPFIVVSVQRSSTLVFINYTDNAKCGQLELAGRGGNPKLRMRTRVELLTDDYDTLCRVDIEKSEIIAGRRLQDAPNGTMQFIGDYVTTLNDTVAVARPFSGDVVLVDGETLTQVGLVAVPDQPLRVAMTSERDIVTRDWKSGAVSHTRF